MLQNMGEMLVLMQKESAGREGFGVSMTLHCVSIHNESHRNSNPGVFLVKKKRCRMAIFMLMHSHFSPLIIQIEHPFEITV